MPRRHHRRRRPGPAGASVTYSATAATDLVDAPLTPTASRPRGRLRGSAPRPSPARPPMPPATRPTRRLHVTVTAYVDTVDPAGRQRARRHDRRGDRPGRRGGHLHRRPPPTTVDGALDADLPPGLGQHLRPGHDDRHLHGHRRRRQQRQRLLHDHRLVDTTKPVVTVPADITVAATGPTGALVTYTARPRPTSSTAPSRRACLPASGTLFAVGTTTVTCTATDAAGNSGRPGDFTVTVTAYVDTVDPGGHRARRHHRRGDQPRGGRGAPSARPPPRPSTAPLTPVCVPGLGRHLRPGHHDRHLHGHRRRRQQRQRQLRRDGHR